LQQRSLAQELGGDLKLTYEPSGLRCVITFPLDSVEETVEAESSGTTNVCLPQ
jgi:hypothetical protein